MHVQISTFRFKYIVVLDIDEVIVPKKHVSWSAMMGEVLKASAKEPKTISWHFRHTYFIDSMTEERRGSNLEKFKDGGPESSVENSNRLPLPASDIPEHLHMLTHIFRSANHSKGRQRPLLGKSSDGSDNVIPFSLFQVETIQSLSLTQRKL